MLIQCVLKLSKILDVSIFSKFKSNQTNTFDASGRLRKGNSGNTNILCFPNASIFSYHTWKWTIFNNKKFCAKAGITYPQIMIYIKGGKYETRNVSLVQNKISLTSLIKN